MITDIGKINTNLSLKDMGIQAPEYKEPEVSDFSRRKLDTYYQHWLSLRRNKVDWYRNSKYYTDDQWHELTTDRTGSTVTEREYISSQGKNPFQYNIIKPTCNSLLGQFRSDRSKSVVIPRMKEKSKECEILSNSLQSVLEHNDMRDLDAAALEQMFWSIPIRRICYKYLVEEKRYDVYAENIDPFSVFFNTDLTDVRGKDISIIGRVLDYSYPELVSAFGKSEGARKQLREIYSHRDDMQYVADYSGVDGDKLFDADFFMCRDLSKCRVIEAWEKLIVDRTRIHDTSDGSLQVTDYTVDEVKWMNRQRMQKYMDAGKDPRDVPMLIPTKVTVPVWHYQYLSPYGHILAQGETPYWHGSHPFVISMSQLVNGKLTSFVADLIDPQRFSNRLMTIWDFILGTSAKNTLIIDRASLDGQNLEDIASDYREVGGVIALNLKDGAKMPVELGKNMANLGIIDMLQLTFKMVQDISGVHPSMQGAQAPSGTSGKLYAQEAQNSTVNSKHIMESFATFRKNSDEKILKTIQQFYDEPRYITISGKSYQDSVILYDPKDVQNIEFELQLAQTADSPVYRTVIDEQLKEFLIAGFIDFETYLENTNLPFSDKLMASIQTAKQQTQGGDVNGAMQTIGGMQQPNENIAKAEQLLRA